MGINRPSLYAAFGNKEQLFRKALDRYQTGPMSFLTEALRRPTARAVVETIFSGSIRMQRGRDKARRGTSLCPGHSRAARRRRRCGRELVQLRQAIVKALRNRFQRTVHDGDLPAGTNCARSAVHRHDSERPGSSGGQRGDREGVAAGCGAGDPSMAALTHRHVLTVLHQILR